ETWQALDQPSPQFGGAIELIRFKQRLGKRVQNGWMIGLEAERLLPLLDRLCALSHLFQGRSVADQRVEMLRTKGQRPLKMREGIGVCSLLQKCRPQAAVRRRIAGIVTD